MNNESAHAARTELDRRLGDTEELTNRIRQAVEAALREHQEAGNPVAGWQDGKVKTIQPQEITLSQAAGASAPMATA
jgi:hypothetical protein